MRRELRSGPEPDAPLTLQPVCERCAERLDGRADDGRPAFNSFLKVGAMGGGLTFLALLVFGGLFAGLVGLFIWFLKANWHS